MANNVTFFDASNYLRRKYEEATDQSGMRTVVRDIRSEAARNQCIFVFDGSYANEYRKAIYPGYKDKRIKGTDEFYTQVRAFEKIVTYLPIISLRIPKYEADDAIGVLAKQFVEKGYGVHIKSTDKDFLQLDGITIEGKEFAIPHNQIVLYKTLVGDPSDNIKGIPGFGKSAWEKLNKETALLWLENDFDSSATPEMGKAVTEWCDNNRGELIAMRDICRFRDVPDELIKKHMIFGKDEPAEVEKILKEYLA